MQRPLENCAVGFGWKMFRWDVKRCKGPWLGSGGSAALRGWFYFAVLVIITQPFGHLMGSRPSPRGVGSLGSREELAEQMRSGRWSVVDKRWGGKRANLECKSFLGIMSRRTREADCATRLPFAQLMTVPSARPSFQRRALGLLQTGWPGDCSPRCPGRRGSQRFRTASALGRWGLAGFSATPAKRPVEAVTTFLGGPGREHDGSSSRGGKRRWSYIMLQTCTSVSRPSCDLESGFLTNHSSVLLIHPVDLLLSAEVSGGDRLDCVKASDQCLKEQTCSTKYRTLRQCVAGKETNFSLASGLEAKDECRNAMEALKQKSLYNCRCKRGMKKEKNCLRIYWSMYQSLQGTLPPPALPGSSGTQEATLVRLPSPGVKPADLISHSLLPAAE